MKRSVRIAAVAAAVLVTVSACSFDKAYEPFRDAGRGTTFDGPADMVTFPDGFSNVATKCVYGNRVFVIYHGDHPYGSVEVAPADPTCKGK